MKLKSDIKLMGVRPEILIIIPILRKVYNYYDKELVITSITGGSHGIGSYHYIGQAIDCRTRYFNRDEKMKVKAMIEKRLTDAYDVILEPTHLHIEYDPQTN